MNRALLAAVTIALVGTIPGTAGPPDQLTQVKQSGRLRLGYRADARPLSFRDEAGKPAGYAVALCEQIAEAMKTELGLSQLAVEWVPVSVEGRFRALQQGEVDLLCGAESATIARRAEVAFSIPTFPGGIGALMRADAPARLREALAGQQSAPRPLWRGTVDPALNAGKFSAVAGTTAEQWLNSRVKDFKLGAQVVPVQSYDAGARAVLDRNATVLFGDRALLLEAARRTPASGELTVLDRFFTYEPIALALPRGDEDLRLLVDRTLSRLYRSGAAAALYAKWCGEPNVDTLAFFRMQALPD